MRRFMHLHLPKPRLVVALAAGLGATLGIGGLLLLSEATHLAWLVASLGATSVLLFAAPAAPVSQPVNVVAGHVLSGAIGIALAQFLPGQALVAGLAVGFSVTAMMLTRLVNPPAGATALVAYTTGAGWWFLLFPVAAGSLLLVLLATVFHRITGGTYPAHLPK